MDDPDFKSSVSKTQYASNARGRFAELDDDSSDDDIVPPTPRDQRKRKSLPSTQCSHWSDRNLMNSPSNASNSPTYEPSPPNSPPRHPMDEYDFGSGDNLIKLRRQADKQTTTTTTTTDDHRNETVVESQTASTSSSSSSSNKSRNGLRKSASYCEAIENNALTSSQSLPDLGAWDEPSTSTGRSGRISPKNTEEGTVKALKKGKKRRSNPMACLQGNSSTEKPKAKRRKNEAVNRERTLNFSTSDSETDSPGRSFEPLVALSDSSDLDSDEWERRVLSGASSSRRRTVPTKLPKNKTRANVGFMDANDKKTRDDSTGVSLISKRSPIFARGRRSAGPTPGPSSAAVASTRHMDEDLNDSLIMLDSWTTSPRMERAPSALTLRTPRMNRRRERTLSGTPVFARRERQLEDDMRMARQLQEQMDMEYARSLASEQAPVHHQPQHQHLQFDHNSHANHFPHFVTGPAVAPQTTELRSPVYISPRRMRNNGSRRAGRRTDVMHDGVNLLRRMTTSPSSSDDEQTRMPMNRLEAGALFRRYYPSTSNSNIARRAPRRRAGAAHFAAGPAHFHDGGFGLMLASPVGAGAGGDYEYLLALGEYLGDAKRKGLSKTSIEQLPTLKYEKKPGSQADDNEECSVCMTGYEVGEELRILPCFHNFHKQCIDRWIKGNATCPICRVAVRLDGQAT